MFTTLLSRLQNWYILNCNGDWEHTYSVKLETLDNPGWSLKIDLMDTVLEKAVFERRVDLGPLHWIWIQVKDGVFDAACSPNQLSEVLGVFFDEILPHFAEDECLYEVYVPIEGAAIQLWRPVQAKVIREDLLEIVHIPELQRLEVVALTIEDLEIDRDTLGSLTIKHTVGDQIKPGLIEMYNGVALVAT